MPLMTVGAARLPYDDAGDGPAVVFLHAGVADRRCWVRTVDALGPRYRAITYDRRGFGASEYTSEPHDRAADLAALLDHCGVQRAAVVGNSQGGRIALEFALAHPSRVTALVLAGTAVRGAPAPDVPADIVALDAHIDELADQGRIDELNDAEARFWLDGPSRPEGFVQGAARELFLDMNRRVLTAEEPGEWIEDDTATPWDRLGEITAPVLAVVGRHDLPHFRDRSRHIARSVRDGTYIELDGSAHLPPLDDPGTFSAVLGDFFRTRLR